MVQVHTYYLVVKVRVRMEGDDLDNQQQEIANTVADELDYEVKFDDVVETDLGMAKAKVIKTEVLALLDENPI